MYLEPRYEFMARNMGTLHQVLKSEWDRIKDDPDPRFAMSKPTVKQCACERPVSEPRDGELVPRYNAVLDQFPWTKRATDLLGVFNHEYVLVQYGLLGMDRKKVGYWAQSVRGNEQMGTWDALQAPWRVLSEAEGWRLPEAHVPSLVRLHEPDTVLPVFPPAFGESWTTYYEWRGLPMDSIAALLLHWPLGVYACLKELGFVSTAVPEERRKLTVFYVGARDEITFIPVFGELALLFPNTDLDLVMYGPSVAQAVKHHNCPSSRPCVYEYTSPAACGAGTLRVFLDSKFEYYRPSRNVSEHPDAIVALNAGLGTYRSWLHLVYLAAELGIPFAATDYGEICVSQLRLDLMEQALLGPLPPTKKAAARECHSMIEGALREAGVVDVDKTCAVLREARNRPVKFNPFMHPETRAHGGSLFFGASNGCVQVVVPRRAA